MRVPNSSSRGFPVRIACCRLILALFAATLLFGSGPSRAADISLTGCSAVSDLSSSAIDPATLRYDCRQLPRHARWLWLRVPLVAPAPPQTLLVRQARFSTLRLVVREGARTTADRSVRSGVGGPDWIVGGFLAFDLPATASVGRTAYVGLENAPTVSVLRARLYDSADFSVLSVRWTVAISLFLGVLATSAAFNAFLLAALRSRAMLFQLLWTVSVLAWGMFWSQTSLLLLPAIAGTWNARFGSVFASLSSALPTLLTITIIERGKLPNWLKRAVIVPAVAMPPVATAVIFQDGPATLLRLVYDAAVVLDGIGGIACCVVAWRRGSLAVRTVVWTFTLPTAVTVVFAYGSLRGQHTWGISEINVLAMAAAQTVLLTASMTFHFLSVRRDRDRALAQERYAVALADAAETANQAKTDFLVRLSHEMRSPLNAVSGHAQLLIRDGDAQARRSGSTILQGTEHIASLLSDLIEISLLETERATIESRPFDLMATLERTVALLQPEYVTRRSVLLLEPQSSFPARLLGDERRIRQILINLITNAAKYGGEGSVRVLAERSEAGVTIAVIDRGPGIAPEDARRIFSAFERGRSFGGGRPGLGLGLTISRALAEAMGGTLAVADEDGGGSRFTLSLPLRGCGEEETATAPPSGPARDRTARHILVLDDDGAHRETVEALLRPSGYVVRTAADLAEALDPTMAAPDLAILDIDLAGSSGWDAAQALRDRHGEAVAILMCSGDPITLLRPRDEHDPHDDFIIKPFAADDLLERIDALLDAVPGRASIGTDLVLAEVPPVRSRAG